MVASPHAAEACANAEIGSEGLRTTLLRVGDRQLVVMSYRIAQDDRATDTTDLTPVEHEIVRAVLDGLSNAEIAA